MKTTTICSLPGCRRKTRSYSGRCHDHRKTTTSITKGAVLPGARTVTHAPVVKKNRNGTKTEEWFDDFGRLHREDGPAATIFTANGHLLHETYYRDGARHREDGPAVVQYSGRGHVVREQWHRHGLIHRFGGLAKIEYLSTGEVREVSHYLDGTYFASGENAMLYAEARYDDDRLRDEFAGSPDYAPLADDGSERLRVYLSGIGLGLRTAEGVRAYADGTPLEWAMSFEEGTR